MEAGQSLKITPTFTARSILSDFGPWIVFGVLSATGHGGAAYVGGLIASLLPIISRWKARRLRILELKIPDLKILDGVTVLFFAAGVVSTLVLRSSVFLTHSSVVAWGTFGLVAWGSLLAGSPFTAQYAREAVPEEYWGDPGFRRVNAVITAVWGTVFVVNAALAAGVLSPMTLKPGAAPGRAGPWLQVLPYVVTVLGIVFTNRYPQWVRRHRQEGIQPAVSRK